MQVANTLPLSGELSVQIRERTIRRYTTHCLFSLLKIEKVIVVSPCNNGYVLLIRKRETTLTKKILVKVWEPAITALRQKTDAACMKRDA